MLDIEITRTLIKDREREIEEAVRRRRLIEPDPLASVANPVKIMTAPQPSPESAACPAPPAASAATR